MLLNDFKLGLRKTTDPEYYIKMKKKVTFKSDIEVTTSLTVLSCCDDILLFSCLFKISKGSTFIELLTFFFGLFIIIFQELFYISI